jgi:RimJ/RimL family protein N-acetyltransferase/predicted enzyme related to lactoylglutathione lyase
LHELPGPERIATRRLDLIPANVVLVDAELRSTDELATALGARIPGPWPPGEYDREAILHFRRCLAEHPDAVGWYGWYVLLRGEGLPVVIGAGGYTGPPDAGGTVEIGYSIVRGYEGRGFATELVRALAEHAFATGRVRQIIARTGGENRGSARVLGKSGFRRTGSREGTVEYVLRAPAGRTSEEGKVTMQIKFVSILVRDQESALRFYTEVLGFEKMADIPMGEYRWLTVTSPDGIAGVELVLEPTAFPPARTFQQALFDAGIAATALTTNDIKTEVERLKERGVRFRSEPQEMGLITAALFEDTCGNLIQLVQPEG